MTMDWFRMGAGGFVWVWWGSGGAPGGQENKLIRDTGGGSVHVLALQYGEAVAAGSCGEGLWDPEGIRSGNEYL